MEAGQGAGNEASVYTTVWHLITWCCLASLSTAGLSSLHNHFCCWWSSSYCMGKTCTWPFKPTSCTYSKWHCDSRNFLHWNPKCNKRIYRYTVQLTDTCTSIPTWFVWFKLLKQSLCSRCLVLPYLLLQLFLLWHQSVHLQPAWSWPYIWYIHSSKLMKLQFLHGGCKLFTSSFLLHTCFSLGLHGS